MKLSCIPRRFRRGMPSYDTVSRRRVHPFAHFTAIEIRLPYQGYLSLSIVKGEAVGKRPSAALPSFLVIATYFYVRLIPRDFGSLAYGHFPPASQEPIFLKSRYSFLNIVLSNAPVLTY